MRDWPGRVKPKYRRAIFLDRDGTINEDTHYAHDTQELLFIPGALTGLRLLAELDFHLIVVSNQAGIPLKIFTRRQMSAFNTAIRKSVKKEGGRLDAFYYSPYLERKNLPAGVAPHASVKPNPGMLLEAAQDFSLTLAESFMLGDKTSDIVAGQLVGCKTILLLTGKAGKEEDAVPCQPDHVVPDLFTAASLIHQLVTQAPGTKNSAGE